jgi:uncharacterized membrane protein YfcA
MSKVFKAAVFKVALVATAMLAAPAILADQDDDRRRGGVAAGSETAAAGIALGSTETYLAVGFGVAVVIAVLIAGSSHNSTTGPTQTTSAK